MNTIKKIIFEKLIKKIFFFCFEKIFKIFFLGEQQIIAICRLFFHKPFCAIFDEATSAVETELQGKSRKKKNFTAKKIYTKKIYTKKNLHKNLY